MQEYLNKIIWAAFEDEIQKIAADPAKKGYYPAPEPVQQPEQPSQAKSSTTVKALQQPSWKNPITQKNTFNEKAYLQGMKYPGGN